MEFAVPLVALTGLYFVNKQSKKEHGIHDYEGFAGQTTNPNKIPIIIIYPPELNI